MAEIIKIKWNDADFKWDSAPPDESYKPGFKPTVFPYTWDEVALIREIISAGKPETYLDKVDKEKKKRLIRLIMKRNGIKQYDEEKEVRNIKAKVKDIELIVKEARSSVKVII